MKPTNNLFFLTTMVLLLLASCDAGSGKGHYYQQCDTIAMKYATNLSMIDYGDFIKVDFRNPWDTTRTLQTFLLVPRNDSFPKHLPSGTMIRTPLENSVVYTCVHNSLIEQLGASDAIAGICDTKYIRKQALRDKIESGDIADCGTSMAPNIEKILMLKPDAILLSAFENSNDHNKVGQIGIPIIDCTDYMETSPLGRAEWMRFYGRLYGKGNAADSLFNQVEQSYLDIKKMIEGTESHPLVLTDLIYGQTWNVPGAMSTTGVIIEDAGGINPFEDYKKSGSVQLSPEEVLYRAQNADVWLIKYAHDLPPSLNQLGKDNPIYSKFKAFHNANVYGCDTDNSTFFEDAAFHPHWVLAEYVSIFHPELGEIEGNQHYYSKLPIK